MATVGGNLFVKQPYGDLAACLIALDAVATVSDGQRDARRSGRGAGRGGPRGRGEIVTEVSFALPAAGAFRFVKAGRKALNAAAIVTVAAVVARRAAVVAACRIALGGVAPRAVRAPSRRRRR